MSSNSFLPKNMHETNILLTWTLICTSIISCYSRADYNLIIGFLILFIRGINNNDMRKILSRLQLQFLIISFIFDIFWMCKFNSYWTHGEETSELWQSLSGIHNLAFFIGIGEFLLKIPMCFFFYKDFIANQGSIKDLLLNFNYKPAKE